MSYVSSEEKKILLAIDRRLDQLDEIDKKIIKIEEKLNHDKERTSSIKRKLSEKHYLEDISPKHHKKNSSTLIKYLMEKKESRRDQEDNSMNEDIIAQSIKSSSSGEMKEDKNSKKSHRKNNF